MNLTKAPSLLLISASPTKGIHKKHESTPAKLYPSFSEKKAVKISRKHEIYRKGRTNTFYITEPVTLCIKPVSDLDRFIKENVKIHQRHMLTDDVLAEIKETLKDPSRGLTLPLPKYNPNYVLLSDGYFNIKKGKFHYFKSNRYNRGYSRFMIHAELKDAASDLPDLEPILPSLGLLLTRFPFARNIVWVTGNELGGFFQRFLKSVLPEQGAFQYLSATAPMPDFQNAAESDSHCIVVKIDNAKELTASLWKKLLVFADNNLPLLILADFQPFMSEFDAILANKLQKHLFIVPASLDVGNLPKEVTGNFSNQLVYCALRGLSLKINAIEPDICPDVDAIFTRPDPNDVPSMLKWLFDEKITQSGDISDVITVQDITARLKEISDTLGGDPYKFTVNGVGKYLNDMGIHKDERKLPTTKGRASVVVGYKWKSQRRCKEDVNR